MNFKVLVTDPATNARLGTFKTAHGELETPFFMPVGTNATVKGISAEEIVEIGAQLMLSNTYHLFLRPGMDIMKEAGGLHAFMHWDRPILTDSGGYQVFSLSQFRKITDEGVKFQSHIDGSRHFLTPEDVIRIEGILGSDMIMPLDECAPYPCERKEAQHSVKRTTLWAKRSREYFLNQNEARDRQLLFGIIQGATFEDLRKQSAEEILSIGFDGYAIGGVSVGEPVKDMFEAVEWVAPMLPENQPRYLMGIGLPDQMVKGVSEGIDMFDTCLPTRYGRHGSAFTSQGRKIITNSEFTRDFRPVDENCDCFVCRKYTCSYIRHLLKAGEMLGLRFLSYHNLYFYVNLMKKIRRALREGTFSSFATDFLLSYGSDLKPSAKR